jgi:nickel/cobalt transporter (NiCoT) family protein
VRYPTGGRYSAVFLPAIGQSGWALRICWKHPHIAIRLPLSVLVALVVGGIETLGLIADQFPLHGVFWNAISNLNDNLGTLGYGGWAQI